MVIGLADVFVQVAHREDAVGVWRRAQTHTRAQPGCLRYQFAEIAGDLGHFVLVQQWRDQAAFDEHYRSAEFAEYEREIEPLLSRSSQLEVHQVVQTTRPVESGPIDPRRAD
jgi:quinol monooxygenase YgiN